MFRIFVFTILVLVSSVSAAVGATETCRAYRLERTDGSWTRPISLDSIHDGRLYISDEDRQDSIAASDVRSIRRERKSHVFGGLVGMVGGALAGVGLAAGVSAFTEPGDHGNWTPALLVAGAFFASVIAGTIWGATEGVTIYPADDLTLDGLDDERRAAALGRFVLDERLRAVE